eukprot:m.168232 g.168232  ORF g.168232 m.168232 type:complete len:207 (+) comp53191_c0_seq10:247-867(+)
MRRRGVDWPLVLALACAALVAVAVAVAHLAGFEAVYGGAYGVACLLVCGVVYSTCAARARTAPLSAFVLIPAGAVATFVVVAASLVYHSRASTGRQWALLFCLVPFAVSSLLLLIRALDPIYPRQERRVIVRVSVYSRLEDLAVLVYFAYATYLAVLVDSIPLRLGVGPTHRSVSVLLMIFRISFLRLFACLSCFLSYFDTSQGGF